MNSDSYLSTSAYNFKPIFNINLLFMFALVFLQFACEDNLNKNENEHERLLFISSEGNFGQSNGSISVFDGNKKVQEVLDVGDVLQSILIHEDHLFAILNGSSEIKRYAISEEGISMPGITISTENSSPREMIVLNDKLYFSNWSSKDIKILNLNTFAIENSIPLNGLPEDIVTDGTYLFVSIPHLALYDQGNGSTVVKIDPAAGQVITSYEVGRGPQHMVIHNNKLIVSRTHYSENWYQTFFGTTQIDLSSENIIQNDHGEGIVCGGNVMVFQEQVYRTSLGGIVPLDQNDLSLDIVARIGNYTSKDSYYNPNVYSSTVIGDEIFFGITNDFVSPDSVYIQYNDSEILLEVGAAPGDYASWQKSN
ncbi:hypothetical protein OAQ12_03375 [Candidatus Marinimicrobia bacterium]|nr:hypothetical protein [Candidatus Neomarinimicrobiota bacterium]